MKTNRFERFAPLTGVLFFIVAVVAILIEGEPPAGDEELAEVIEFWTENDTENVVSAILAAYATVLFLWFAGCVRANIACVERPGSRLASTAMAGAAVFAAGVLLNSGLQVIAADTVGDVSPEVTQTLSALYDGMYFPLAGGLATFLLASGLGAVRHGAFDPWLGRIAIGLGVLCLTPAGIVGFMGGLVWVGLAGAVLFRKAAEPPTRPAAPA